MYAKYRDDARLRVSGPLFLALIFTSHAAFAQGAAPHLPDMSSYNCASAANAASTRHIGQVIRGQYHEWFESFVQSGDQQRLVCIGIVRPNTQQLSADEAKAFLTSSLAVGALTPEAAANLKRALAAPAGEESVEPDNVQAEPLKSLREPTATTQSLRQSTAPDTEQPPIPAAKNFDGSGNVVPSSVTKIAPAASATSSAAPATAGIEDRVPNLDTQSYPWNTLAYFTSTYPAGGSFRCSATLVSPYVALTAGHCVHNNTRGGYIASGRLAPGQRQAALGDGRAIQPYGTKSDIASVQTTAQWTQISGNDSYPITDYRYDYAAIEFRTPFTHTSTFMPVLYGSTGSVTSAGYPAVVSSLGAYGQWVDDAPESSRSASSYRYQHVREFAADASGGNSGGAFIYTDASTGQSYLVGSLSYGNDLNDSAGGPWYDSWNQALISSWVSWVPGKESIASSSSGLRVASVFSETQAEMMSYLRFYNAGGMPGTVDVTLADYATGALLGTWRSPALAAGSSQQFSIREIEDNANATFAKPLIYSLSVRPTFAGSFQNVLWRKIDNTLTNLSTCDTQERSTNTLINVHSSLMDGGYPSGVVLHNTSAGTASPTFGIFDAQTGTRLGTYRATLAANSQQILTVGAMENAAGIIPSAYHYIIKAESGFTGYMQHLLNNKAARLITDMTETCTLAP